ncbi:MAG: M15 family metallopeptidase [Eubacteriales bacterium]
MQPNSSSTDPRRRPPEADAQRSRDASRTDRSADYARRQEAYRRRREYEAMQERRRKAKRERAVRVFLGRALVFAIVLVILAVAAALVFWLHFNKSNPPPEPSSIRYTFGGTEGASLAPQEAYSGNVLYIDFSEAAKYLDMSMVGGASSMRYVLASSAEDSAGSGGEEAVVFHAGSDLAEVNGQNIRLEGKAIVSGEHYLVPVSFLSEYMTGVSVLVTSSEVAVARTYTDGEPDPVAFTLKNAGVVAPIPEDTELSSPVVPPTDEELKITFQADLSAYEAYMNPADRDAYLILVNNSSTIDETYKPDDLVELADTRKDGRAAQMMRKTAAKALEAMFIEMRACGYTDVSVTSAYRSYAYQSSLFNMYTANEMAKDPSLTLAQAQAITATYSARPGTSEHQTGLCCDMHNLPAADQSFAKKEAYAWLTENAWKFGFILRFPEGKENVTEISFEPWHYRFVGRYHAKAIHDAGLCLEEYLAELEKN